MNLNKSLATLIKKISLSVARIFWVLLGVAGLGSFSFGLAGSVMPMKNKNQAFTIFAVCVLLIVNEFAVKAALDVYNLATPWAIIALSLGIAVVSGVLISNSNNSN